jgi:hypothetical protein
MSHPDTCLTFERDGRTIEVDELSRSGGMDDTYAVYENEQMLGDFMTTTPWGRITTPLADLAWSVVLESEAS